MTDPLPRDSGPEEISPNDVHVDEEPVILLLHTNGDQVRASARAALSPQQGIKRELRLRRRSRELSRYGIDPFYLIRLNDAGIPLRRNNLQNSTGLQAVEPTHDECMIVGHLLLIDCHGVQQDIDLQSIPEGKTVILFPEDLGDEEGKPFLHVVH
ncbi:MAG: hypothetical protein ABIG34_04365 [Candidatus Peregrinibacteria bacterium]